jgi:hypothetical protein
MTTNDTTPESDVLARLGAPEAIAGQWNETSSSFAAYAAEAMRLSPLRSPTGWG